ncbi:hypothetical protein ABZ912_09525 [Nonomuraea angiospora]|uniref:hypothetical protein n=1 Tax=Nonomuraea angiospora TaxID=46172 RepID=UPI0033FAFCDB
MATACTSAPCTAARVADNPDAVWQEAVVHYDEEAPAALVMAISTINAWNRVNLTPGPAPPDRANAW